MHRLLVALLAALDAVIAAAGGVAIVLAPLTLLWVVGLGSGADWAALWPAAGAIWQLGHLVPLAVTLPVDYVNLTGIDPAGASFTLSLAPLALGAFTAVFAARSGRRAAQAGAWATGALGGTIVFTVVAATIALTSANSLARAELWQAILFPALVYGVPALVGAFVEGWRLDERGATARFRVRLERDAWGVLPGLVVRGTAMAVAGLVGVGAAATGVAVILGGGEVVALFEAAHVDTVGVIVLALAQLAYLPTLVVWGLSFVAGPGFAVGAGSAVSPSATQLGVLPGIPIFGAVPESSTSWLLLLALLPVAVGVLTGWMLRSRLAAEPRLSSHDDGGLGLRVVLAVAVALSTAAIVALLAFAASGSVGPGRLSDLGPAPGPLALSVGVEVVVGAAILLLLPRRSEAGSDTASVERRDATSSPGVRLAATEAGTDAWQRLAAELSFPQPERPLPEADPWVAPPAPSAEAIAENPLEGVDDDATEPIPGFERGSGPSSAERTEDGEPTDGRHPPTSID